VKENFLKVVPGGSINEVHYTDDTTTHSTNQGNPTLSENEIIFIFVALGLVGLGIAFCIKDKNQGRRATPPATSDDIELTRFPATNRRQALTNTTTDTPATTDEIESILATPIIPTAVAIEVQAATLEDISNIWQQRPVSRYEEETTL
jgi:hypothetical protein